MSWLKQRGRAQRSVMSIVNCRTPGIDRHLNAACASGTGLGADLIQCCLVAMQAEVLSCFANLFVHQQLLLLLLTHLNIFAWARGLCSEIWNQLAGSSLLAASLHRQRNLSKTWAQVSKPAEFKHISKRRKAN